MNQKICDLCGEVIEGTIFYLSVTEAVLPKREDLLAQFVTLEEAFRLINQKQQELRKNTQYFEICKGCKKGWDYMLTMRRDQIQDLKNEVEGVFKLPYLKKGDSEDV